MKLSYLIGVGAIAVGLTSCVKFSSHGPQMDPSPPSGWVSSNYLADYYPTNEIFLDPIVQDTLNSNSYSNVKTSNNLENSNLIKKIETSLNSASSNLRFSELKSNIDPIPLKEEKKSSKMWLVELILASAVVYGGYRYYVRYNSEEIKKV